MNVDNCVHLIVITVNVRYECRPITRLAAMINAVNIMTSSGINEDPIFAFCIMCLYVCKATEQYHYSITAFHLQSYWISSAVQQLEGVVSRSRGSGAHGYIAALERLKVREGGEEKDKLDVMADLCIWSLEDQGSTCEITLHPSISWCTFAPTSLCNESLGLWLDGWAYKQTRMRYLYCGNHHKSSVWFLWNQWQTVWDGIIKTWNS